MNKISDATIDSLARRNYESAMQASWDAATPEARAAWIEEAAEQCAIILDGFAVDKQLEPHNKAQSSGYCTAECDEMTDELGSDARCAYHRDCRGEVTKA
jgi:hypothetical protein